MRHPRVLGALVAEAPHKGSAAGANGFLSTGKAARECNIHRISGGEEEARISRTGKRMQARNKCQGSPGSKPASADEDTRKRGAKHSRHPGDARHTSRVRTPHMWRTSGAHVAHGCRVAAHVL